MIAFEERNLLRYTWNYCDEVSEIYTKRGKKTQTYTIEVQTKCLTKFNSLNTRILSSLTFVTKPAEQFGEKHSHLMAEKNS